jgi:putative transposase
VDDSTSLARTYRYRLYPTRRQEDLLRQMLWDHHELYNAALQERREAWKVHGVRVTHRDLERQIADIRSADPDGLGRWDVHTLRRTLKRLDLAFAAFFRRVKAGQTPGYPRQRSPQRFDSVTCEIGYGAGWKNDRFRLFGIGDMKVRVHREWRGTPKIAHVIRSGRKWYVALVCEGVPRQVRELTGREIGLDRGVTTLLADSDGGFVPNPRFHRTSQEKLAVAQQALARKKRGSARRRKVVERVAGMHRKISGQRRDVLHKISRKLVNEYDLVVLEDLRTANMTSRPAPRAVEDSGGTAWEPNGAAAKSGLNKSILDAGWGVLANMITYKAEEAGTQLVLVNPANTSRMCYQCGSVAAGNREGVRFRCLACGHTAHADTNAARNILRAGWARQAVAA